MFSGSAYGSRTHFTTMIEGSFEGVKQAPGSHQNETNETIRIGGVSKDNSELNLGLNDENMRTDSEQMRELTDEELGDLVGFFELLARVDRRMKGWRERLKTEPEGFPMNNGIYDCNLCRQSMSNYEGWYDQYGLKCPLCRKAVNDGIVPGSAVLDDTTWFSVSQLSKKYGWHHTTIHKKVRSGELKARIVRNTDGKPYFYVFLKEENRGWIS